MGLLLLLLLSSLWMAGQEVIRAAVQADVDFFVYCSMYGASMSLPFTPYTISTKTSIEAFLRSEFRHSGYAIVRPSFLMEDFVLAAFVFLPSPSLLFLFLLCLIAFVDRFSQNSASWWAALRRHLPTISLIGAEDVGAVVTSIFKNPAAYTEQVSSSLFFVSLVVCGRRRREGI